MSTVLNEPKRSAKRQTETLADLIGRLGDIPPERIRLWPSPGTATERDLESCPEDQSRLVELVEGTLVEKPMGNFESHLALVLAQMLLNFLDKHNLGILLGPDSILRYRAGLIRKPDVSFFSWRHFPSRKLPRTWSLKLAPDLAVEILSPSNTRREMERKRQECFAAGTRLVWEIDPRSRKVAVYTSPERCATIDEKGTLDGGKVLPGFKLRVKDLFKRADEHVQE